MQTMELSGPPDKRVEDLGRRVNSIDREMHAEFRAVRLELNTRFDATQKLIVTLMCTVIGGFVSVLAAMVATQF